MIHVINSLDDLRHYRSKELASQYNLSIFEIANRYESMRANREAHFAQIKEVLDNKEKGNLESESNALAEDNYSRSLLCHSIIKYELSVSEAILLPVSLKHVNIYLKNAERSFETDCLQLEGIVIEGKSTFCEYEQRAKMIEKVAYIVQKLTSAINICTLKEEGLL